MSVTLSQGMGKYRIANAEKLEDVTIEEKRDTVEKTEPTVGRSRVLVGHSMMAY